MYLNRFDYLLYMDKLLNKARSIDNPRPEDLVQDEELMADVGVGGADAAGPARNGTAKSRTDIAAIGPDGKRIKRKPGPKPGIDYAAHRAAKEAAAAQQAQLGLTPAGNSEGQDGEKRKPGPKKGWKKEKMRLEAEARRATLAQGVKLE